MIFIVNPVAAGGVKSYCIQEDNLNLTVLVLYMVLNSYNSVLRPCTSNQSGERHDELRSTSLSLG